MQVNLHDAKTHLSRYLRGQATISADLKALFQQEMEEMVSGD